MLTLLALLCFVAAAIASRTRFAGWAVTLIAAGLALAVARGLDVHYG